MTVVSNTGPLIGLAKVGRLDLLQELFGEVLIPPTVQRVLAFGRSGPKCKKFGRRRRVEAVPFRVTIYPA